MDRAIVLEPEYAGNMGFMARAADNFDIDELVFVNPQCELGEEAKKRAAHAQKTLEQARIVDELGTVLDDLDLVVGTTGKRVDEENVHRHATSPREVFESISDDARLGILLGREGNGLSNAELDRCDVVVSVPTSADYPVMNLSHAAAVLFYARFQSSREGGEVAASRAQRAALENLFKDVAGTLDWNESRREKTLRAWRNVLGRSSATGVEVQLLCGLFRAVYDTLGDT